MSSELSKAVFDVLSEIEAQIVELKQKYHLHCPPGCGRCCESPKVEASVLEMLPIAEMLWAKGEVTVAHWIALADRIERKGTCVFYAPDSLFFGQGRCSIYPWRPTLCRLFGFAAVRDKQRQVVFAPCSVVKKIAPQIVTAIQEQIEGGNPILCFTDAAQQVANLDPTLGARRYPINQSLVLALERVGFLATLTTEVQQAELQIEPDDNQPNLPTKPRTPRRAA